MRWLMLLLATLVLQLSPFRMSAASQTNVQMLVPGFTVRELPVRLSNLNNLRFAPNGRLTALGYDGRVHLLRDTDGDGLEDRVEIFWDQPTLNVPVGMVWSSEGLYVSSNGKISLLRDTDSDGKPEREEIIASGWPSVDAGGGGVDATALTRDREGNLYFGLMVANYANAYRLSNGVAHYDINSPRGTIQKWSAKTKKLETIATGIRVPYTLAFNRHGDLFVTDQEGETWMPNGNPLDELNHIIPGRNYGFPPRHEKWLPNLISEPPVVAFGPQHQSTCGFVFNEPEPQSKNGPGRKQFGPKWWEGDAFVAGESRGKIWRVRLVKTPHGYVGKEHLIACLNLLTTDVAISPRGDLYVCCHSGPPDWGTGPKGEGRIFKITYTEPKAPQPIVAWPAGQMEVHVAFDRPLDPSVTNGLAGREIEFGEFVRAGDRYEVLKPPYQVVKNQEATLRGKLKIVGANLDKDGQTLVLTTDPHPLAVTYALTIPGVKAKGRKGEGETVEVDYDLSGVVGSLSRAPILFKLPYGGEDAAKFKLHVPFKYPWYGWLPAADHTTAARLSLPLQPLTRAERKNPPGKLDWFFISFRFNLPLDGMTVHARAKSKIEFYPGPIPIDHTSRWQQSQDPDGRFHLTIDMDSKIGMYSFGNLTAKSSYGLIIREGPANLELSYSYRSDPTERPFTPRQLIVGWHTGDLPATKPQPNALAEANVSAKADLGGGDWQRGKELFSSDQLKCATCHRIRGEGALTGPDLSNLVHRDAASVLRDIREPSAAFNPDYVAFNIWKNDGEQWTGFVRAQTAEALRVIGADGKEAIVKRTDVQTLTASSLSLMPTGLLDALKEGQIRDLLTYLLHEPPQRTRAEVERLFVVPPSGGPAATTIARKNDLPPPPAEAGTTNLSIVLIASKQDHGPGEHDYPAWQTNWAKLLGQDTAMKVSTAWEWPTPEQFQHANALVFYFWNHAWTPERYQQLDEFLERGGGVVLLHAACIADKEPELLAGRIGLSAQPVRTKYRHCPIDLKIIAPPDHPITRGLPSQIHFLDETYWPMIGDTNQVEVLATAEEEGKRWPMFWTFQKGKGRVFGSILGHYTWTHNDPFFRILVLRGLAWAAGQPVGRWESLATAGVVLN